MHLPQNPVMAPSLLVMLMILHSCNSSPYSQLTDVDIAIKKFISNEQRWWSDINASTNQTVINATLEKLYKDLDVTLNLADVGSVGVVTTINPELAEKIENIKRTQRQSTKWLTEKNYQYALTNCDHILQTIPNTLSEVFDLTKRPDFLAYLRDNSDFCQTNKRFVTAGVEDLNLQNVVMDFYITVAETLTKGYMTSQMAYMVQGAKAQGKKYQRKSTELQQTFNSQYQTLEMNVRSIVQNFSGEIWNCDDFSKEYSYAEITNFIQGYVDNEVNFNQDGTCRKTCSDYQQVEYHVCRNHTLCILNYLDKNKTRCDGEIRSCRFIESDMTVCPNEDDQQMTRRYNYIRYNSGLMLGQPQHCQNEVKAKSWIRWFVSCSYCFCYCDHENQYSDRFFSLREAVSDIERNKVVTGIRLFKRDRVIHLFISQRTIGRNGKIDESSSSDDADYLGDYNFVIGEGQPDIDYHRLTWNSRGIELDTIRAQKDEVVTGVRFRIQNNRIRFEIRTTPYNRENGLLSRESKRTVWRGNNYHDKEKIPNDDLDVPTRSPKKSKRDRSQNKYIEFTPTDIYKDIAQTTVPFIDTQPVEAKIPKPLRGAGLYYKTTPGYGGFIGPLIILHDDYASNKHFIWFGVFLLLTNVLGDQQILIDKFTSEYFPKEKALWKKIDTQLILLDRGSLLNEIYREHSRILSDFGENNEFGEIKVLKSLGVQKYSRLISTVQTITSNVKNIKEHLAKAEYTKLVDLAKNAANQIQNSANDLHNIIGKRSFWIDLVDGNGESCLLGDVRNSNELVFDVYKELSAISLESYINLQLTHMILKVTQEGGVTQLRADDVRKTFYDGYVQTQNTVKDVLKTVSSKKWICDKRNFPIIYHQINRFIQGYVENEINLNGEQSCSQHCSDYKNAHSFGCAEGTLCAESHIDQASTLCKGTIYNCAAMDDELTVCPSLQKLSTRRYDYVRSSNGKTFGKYDNCLQTARVRSWRKSIWLNKCSNCFCYCDERSDKSDRYFSLHDVTANIQENRIVTGVAITKRNRMIQFLIGESILLPYGKLNTTITHETGDLNVNNRYVGHPEFSIDSNDVRNGIDFHTLTYEKRSINLDSVLAPAGKLVTGVRFHVLDDGVLTIQIRCTDFDYQTGKLKNLDKSIWIHNDVKLHREILLDEPDHPIRGTRPLEPDWTPNQFIKFQPSDIGKDAAQVTVPFLDGTFVEGISTLLTGIGLYYKGQPHFGGAIAPYLVAFDFGSLINPIQNV
ncbi:uncharacterized protein LOC116339329 [Contarinia nasturtii]|uniref:uncharacterized protein LOC116339329 n=1 Tax=Contarinia nasturtii TaxID=265458 RepID=UPI0012D394F6|nr:uncharacterized protein LOC116339329 [Contarinia nasturtii]